MFDIYQLFESVGIIVDSKLGSLQLDRTIECTIIDTSFLHLGYCIVQHGDVQFQANCASGSFKNGDIVYVSLLKGDYSNAYIITKKANSLAQTDKDELITIIDAYKTFVPLYTTSFFDLRVNNTTGYSINTENLFYNNLNGYKKFGVSCYVNSNLTNQCSYGIRFYLFNKQKKGDNEYIQLSKIVDMNLTHLLGAQSKNSGTRIQVKDLFDIADIENLYLIKAEFYSDSMLIAENDTEHYLQISDLVVTFGHDQSTFATPGIYLYGETAPEYTADNASEMSYNIYAYVTYEIAKEQYHTISSFSNESLPKNISIYWNDSTLINNNLTYNIEQGQLKAYEDTYSITAKMQYDSIVSAVVEEYTTNFILTNTTSKADRELLNHYTNVILTANQTNFGKNYNADGTIVDLFTSVNDEQYALYLLSGSPITTRGRTIINDTDDLQLKIILSVSPLSKNVSLQNYSKYNFTQVSDTELSYYKLLDTVNNWDEMDEHFCKDLLMPFSIAEYCLPSEKDVITCTFQVFNKTKSEVIEQMMYELQLDFTRQGVCQTDYVLIGKMTNELGEPTSYLSSAADRYVNLEFQLFNSKGEQIEILKRITTSWMGKETISTAMQEIIDIEYLNDYTIRIKNKQHLINDNKLKDLGFNLILVAEYSMFKDGINTPSRTICYKPLPINNSYIEALQSDLISYFVGPTTFAYDSSGGNPSYYDTDLRLYSFNKQQLTNYTMELQYNKINNKINDSFYPKLISLNSKTKITVPTMLIKNTESSSVILVKDSNKTILWIQPLVLYQIKSFSSYINDWDGKSLQLDSDKMLTPFLGAGKIDEQGFSGVMLGDAATVVEDGSTPLTGIYGYGQGEQSFAFKEDGTAFIGKAGEGRIYFNGNDGLIYSANFDGSFNISNLFVFEEDDFKWVGVLDPDNLGDNRYTYIKETCDTGGYNRQVQANVDAAAGTLVISNISLPATNANKRPHYFKETIKINSIHGQKYKLSDPTKTLYDVNFKPGDEVPVRICVEVYDENNIFRQFFQTKPNFMIKIGTVTDALLRFQPNVSTGTIRCTILDINTSNWGAEDEVWASCWVNYEINNFMLTVNGAPDHFVAPEKGTMDQQLTGLKQIPYTDTGKTAFADLGSSGTYFNLKTGELITNNAVLRENCQIYGTLRTNHIATGAYSYTDDSINAVSDTFNIFYQDNGYELVSERDGVQYIDQWKFTEDDITYEKETKYRLKKGIIGYNGGGSQYGYCGDTLTIGHLPFKLSNNDGTIVYNDDIMPTALNKKTNYSPEPIPMGAYIQFNRYSPKETGQVGSTTIYGRASGIVSFWAGQHGLGRGQHNLIKHANGAEMALFGSNELTVLGTLNESNSQIKIGRFRNSDDPIQYPPNTGIQIYPRSHNDYSGWVECIDFRVNNRSILTCDGPVPTDDNPDGDYRLVLRPDSILIRLDPDTTASGYTGKIELNNNTVLKIQCGLVIGVESKNNT